MKRCWLAFRHASVQAKIFWVVTLSVGLLTVGMCLYPYLWFDKHRSGKEKTYE